MKRKVLKYLVITVLSAVFTSCQKDDDDSKVQLLETITYSSGNSAKYEYDNQNRISKMYTYMNTKLLTKTTITYSGKDLITFMHEDIDYPENNLTGKHIKNGYTITSYKNEEPTGTIYLNNDGYPIRTEGMTEEEDGEWVSYIYTFQYQDGNMIKMNYTASLNGVESVGSTEYKYDNKKSPLNNCKSPTWLVGNPLGSLYGRQNNVIEQTSSFLNVKIEYDYEYDDAEYPTKCTMTYKAEIFEGNEYKNIIEFKYK